MRMTPSTNLLVSSRRSLCIFFSFVMDAISHIDTCCIHFLSSCLARWILYKNLFDSFYCRNCADRHHSDELEVLLSAQGHHHHSHPCPVAIPPQLSSLLMMQDLGFQWSNYSFVGDTSPMSMNDGRHDGHSRIKEEDTLNSRSSCASTAAACHETVVVDDGGDIVPASMAVANVVDGTVLPSINISRTTHHQRTFPVAPPLPLPGDAFEILASSRLCKTLLLSQASSVLLHNGMPLLRTEHVPYGPPAAHLQGPTIDNYKQVSQSTV